MQWASAGTAGLSAPKRYSEAAAAAALVVASGCSIRRARRVVAKEVGRVMRQALIQILVMVLIRMRVVVARGGSRKARRGGVRANMRAVTVMMM